MLSFLKENSEYLFKRQAISQEVFNSCQNPPMEWLKEWEKISSCGTLSKNNILYHSRHDPHREAFRQIEKLQLEREKSHLICLGAGLGYILYPLAEKEILSCLLVEPDMETLFYLLSFVEPKIIKKLNLTIHSRPVEKDNLEEILPFLQGKNVQDIKIYQHRPSYLAFPGIYATLNQRLKSLLEKRAINQATIVKFQDLWNKNIFLNYPIMLASYPYEEFIKVNQTHSIVVAGAGPSLYDSFDDLKKWRQFYWLFCADTAFIPLIKNGIEPNVVFASDPQVVNRFYGFTANVEKSIWCIDPVVNYHLTHFLHKKKVPIISWDNPFFADIWLREITGNRGEVEHGGSVSTNAFATALRMAQERVILVGQDLSFPEKRAHVRGASLEEMIFIHTHRFYHIEEHNYKQMKALPPIFVKAIQGNDVPTNAKLIVFAKWFQEKAMFYKQQEPKLYNATRKGAYLSGFIHSSFEEIFSNEKRKAPHLVLPSITFQKFTGKVQDKLNELLKQIDELFFLYQMFLNKNFKGQVEIPLHLKKANELLSLKTQSLILRITEGGEANLGEKFYLAMMQSAKEHKSLVEKLLHKLKSIS